MTIDAQTLERIAEENYDGIYAYCRRRVNADDDASDLTQAVFLALATAYADIDPTRVRQWLYTTAHHQVVNHYRRQSREQKRISPDPLDETLPGRDDDPYLRIELAELERDRDELLARLSRDERELCADIRQYNRGEVSYRTLAEKYAVPEVTVRMRASRLRHKVQRWITELLCLLLISG